METILQGAVFKCGSQITAYQIVPQAYWDIGNPEPDGQTLGDHLFEGLLSADATPVPFEKGRATVLVAGRNFGCGGKSIAQPILALRYGGISLVVAESISRYCYRNLVNLAVPALLLPDALRRFSSFDEVSADLAAGTVTNLTTGREYQCLPQSALALDILAANGAVNYFCGSVAARQSAATVYGDTQ